ncbi:hypothetical protein B0T26DRAFT_17353 [Lasiosphaeria miniovina]|uniref:BHLH domain-containing protein n=1 Tax=Lasiosphaeria miniovina TaxID=1954250 RepID=A0AA40BG96_9PEZI|nr:uncharacterized protein B0T26DRAFT_17353 [Lasiosphaeria miniovina]KAK0733388.1 hypothetical protein B0T26DRAFT_17353 [Lasiosphaeria miniovina]
MAQHGFQMGGHGGSAIDPTDLAMSGNYQSSFQGNYSGHNNSSNAFSTGSALFGDDELLDGLGSPTEPQSAVQGHGQDFSGMSDMSIGYAHGVYGSHHGLPMDQAHVNGFSSTPDGDPIQSPFVHNFGQYRQIQHPQSFGGSLQSPLSFPGSPMGAELNEGGDPNYLNAKARARMSQSMQRKTSGTRNPLTSKTAPMAALSMNSEAGFPIRTAGARHEKSLSGQWIHTPNSLSSFPTSGFSSPLQPNMHSQQINDILLKGGTSMPAKLGATATTASPQDLKKKKRRESHNLVERRRRDNINERIQDLSKLVPGHRLEDDKIRKAIQNNTPLSPTLTGVPSPAQATSALAGPGARRAAGGTAGNITTGLPIEDKDKQPNKGDILNGAVSWTRDLMWMLHLKIQQQEELINALIDRGGSVPFEFTEDEQRMQTELMEAISRNEEGPGKPRAFSYSRTAGSGLRVPHHTDYKGEPLNGSNPTGHISVSPDDDSLDGASADLLNSREFIDYEDDDLNFKEEDEYGMDLTQ